VQGPAEEVLFRGWLLPVIGARYLPWIGVLVSSLIFSLAHAGSMSYAPLVPLALLNLFLLPARFGLSSIVILRPPIDQCVVADHVSFRLANHQSGEERLVANHLKKLRWIANSGLSIDGSRSPAVVVIGNAFDLPLG